MSRMRSRRPRPTHQALASARPQGDVLFITATDTGVGKTLLTALLLHHLRRRGVDAQAIKPFSAGGGEDLRILAALQPNTLSADEMGPFRFRAPLAPAVAARLEQREVSLRDAVASVNRVRRRCGVLLVEGCGGLQVPLGRSFTVADLLCRVARAAVIVARNQLGVLNHVLLTVNALGALGFRTVSIALMGQARPDASASTNERTLSDWTGLHVCEIPFLGPAASDPKRIIALEKKLKKTLAHLIDSVNLRAAFGSGNVQAKIKP